jgi:sigma-E factor negative regulatory protein RseB
VRAWSRVAGAGTIAAALVSSGVHVPAVAGDAGTETRALRLLQRAARAQETLAYAGVQSVTSRGRFGTTRVVADVEHRPGRGMLVRLRHPGAKPAAFGSEWSPPLPGAPGGGPVGLLVRNYEVVISGAARVGGRLTDVVDARWPGGPVAGRFWLDRTHGLMLRRETYDHGGTTTGASALLDVRLDPPVTGWRPPGMFSQAGGHRAAAVAKRRLRDQGWTLAERLPAGLRLYEARRLAGATGPVVHAGYSDGLCTVSVFEQRGRLDPTGRSGFRPSSVAGRRVYVRDGVPQQVTWSSGGSVFTVLGDAPPETVAAVVRSLPAGPPRDRTDLLERLRRGLARVGSWVNPFA